MSRTYRYMHTINGEPARYVHGTQVTIAAPRKAIPLARSLAQIHREQRASIAWRKRKGFPLYDHYGYRRVTVEC